MRFPLEMVSAITTGASSPSARASRRGRLALRLCGYCVLEPAAGVADRHGINPGDHINLTDCCP